MRGVVSFSADPDTHITIDDTWAAQVRDMGFTFVRTPMPTDALGNFPTDLYRQAFDCYRRAGLSVRAVINPGFLPKKAVAGDPYPLYANNQRNTSGDRLNSPFIEAFSLRLAAVLRQLPEVESVYIWNEPNLLGTMLKPGARVPQGDKGAALAPDVFAALCWQTAKRIKHYRHDMRIFCGALSLLPTTGLDAKNPYLAAYLEAFYQTFIPYHQGHPWPWDGLALNMEGWWTLERAAAAIGCVRQVMAHHLDTGILTVGEWGVRNGDYDPQKASDTFDALSSVLDGEGAFFQDPARTPSYDLNGYGDYGISLWRQNNDTAHFERLGNLPWYETLTAKLKR